MTKSRNFGIGKKLVFFGVVITAIAAAALTGITIWQNIAVEKIVEEETRGLSRQGQEHIIEGILAMLTSQQEVLEEKIASELNVAREVLEQAGGARFTGDTIEWTAVNQLTQERRTIRLPEMSAGNVRFGQNDDISRPTPVVDRVQELVGSTCTVFQRMNEAGDMLRIATNVRTLDNKRAIGTFIPAKNADGLANDVVGRILEGRRYTGRAFVVNKWYVASYEPILGSGGDVIGMLYVGIPEESAASLRRQIMNITVGQTGYVSVVDLQGNYIISHDGERDGENIWDSRDADGNFFIQGIINQAKALKPGEFARAGYLWENPGDAGPREKTVEIGYFAPWQWVITAGTWDEELLTGLQIIQQANLRSRMIMLLVLIGVVAGSGVFWFFLARGITRPIKKTAEIIKRIGEGDFTRSLDIRSRDEIGELARDYNLAAENVRNLFGTITEKTGVLSNIGLELSSNMNQAAASVSQINANIQSIQNQTENQSASVTETGATVRQISTGIEIMGDHIKEQADSVDQSYRAIEEMLENITSVSRNLASNGESMEELARVSQDSRTNLMEVSVKIRDIAKESEELLRISSVIQDIASQTNLLSMNAAIEAAHAGETGRGFAVVADEIRKLAESSGAEAKTISSVLKSIKDSMDKITRAADTVLGQFEDINTRILGVSDQEQDIRQAMIRQEENSRGIQNTMERLNDLTSKVKSSSQEMLHGSREVMQESDNLTRITETITAGMGEMVQGVNEISQVIYRVNDMSQENKDSIEILTAQMEKFRV